MFWSTHTLTGAVQITYLLAVCIVLQSLRIQRSSRKLKANNNNRHLKQQFTLATSSVTRLNPMMWSEFQITAVCFGFQVNKEDPLIVIFLQFGSMYVCSLQLWPPVFAINCLLFISSGRMWVREQ